MKNTVTTVRAPTVTLIDSDGIHWQQVSTINKGLSNDETDIEFLPGTFATHDCNTNTKDAKMED